MKNTFSIQHVEGHGSNDHFGREIQSRLDGQRFANKRLAVRALDAAMRSHGGSQPGRFVAIRSDGVQFEI